MAGGRRVADGTEKKKSAVCKACDEECVETLLHMLVECKAYDKERGEWWTIGVGSLSILP